MEKWITLEAVYSTEKEANKAATVVKVTESRLSSKPGGPQYDIEIELVKVEHGWRIRWRKVPVAGGAGCSKCGSCQTISRPARKPAKVIPFKPRQQ
ncbi:hypothetical protein [Phosphitispora sp. TUW77]|uniref:hypothetical protein n=1 Tax=Phosphitispora sp. TUW77 TaxID=3152361 RepID=UPI003AB8F45C